LIDLRSSKGASAAQQIYGFEEGCLATGIFTDKVVETGPWLQVNGM
jgi:hypothetical protein